MQEGSYTCLVVKQGHRWARAVVIKPPVDVKRIELRDKDKKVATVLRPMFFEGQPYPVERAIRRLLEAGRTLGITDRAHKLLEGLATGCALEVQTGTSASETPQQGTAHLQGEVCAPSNTDTTEEHEHDHCNREADERQP